jgi:hypothetical protein
MADEVNSGLSGTRVRVCYSDCNWYYGSIDSYHEPTGKYRISLDDGDRIFAVLPDPDVELLTEGMQGMRRGAMPVPAGHAGIFKRRRVSHQVERFEPGLEGKQHEANPAKGSPAPASAGKAGAVMGKPGPNSIKSPAPPAGKGRGEAAGKDKPSKDAARKDGAGGKKGDEEDGGAHSDEGSGSGLRGVSRRASHEPGHRRWQAHITIAGKKQHLGVFSLREEAALAYDAAALRHYGADAKLNFPGKGKASGAHKREEEAPAAGGKRKSAVGEPAGESDAGESPPPPLPSRTNWTRLVPRPVLNGHVSSPRARA